MGTWELKQLYCTFMGGLMPRPHPRREGLVTFDWFLGLHQRWLLSVEIFKLQSHIAETQYGCNPGNPTAAQWQPFFGIIMSYQSKESAECLQTLSSWVASGCKTRWGVAELSTLKHFAWVSRIWLATQAFTHPATFLTQFCPCGLVPRHSCE